MTIFCTAVTGFIFVLLSSIFLILYYENVLQNFRSSYDNATESALLHLYNNNVISFEWLGNLQNTTGLTFFLMDNGELISYQDYHENFLGDSLDEILSYANANYNLRPQTIYLPENRITFDYVIDHEKYLVSVANIAKPNGSLCLITFGAYRKAENEFLRFLVCTILLNLTAIFLLFLFSGVYTKKLLLPIQKNQEKQMLFVAGASHELKTPLAVLLSGIEVLELTEDKKQRLHFTGLLRKELQGMKQLIEELLLLTKANAGRFCIKKEMVDVSDILTPLVEKYQLIAREKKLTLSCRMEQNTKLNCDPVLVAHILAIFIENAIFYTETGSVTITYDNRDYCFCVTDTGKGISKEASAHIFDYFYQEDSAHNSKEHFGLGLSIAVKLAENIGGRIWYEEGTPCGSRFYLSLK